VAKGADCKSAGLRLRRFESYLPHQRQDVHYKFGSNLVSQGRSFGISLTCAQGVGLMCLRGRMAFYLDLTPYVYARAEPRPDVLNIGWLAREQPFPQSTPDSSFVDALRSLIAHPTNLFRGSHLCEFCPPPPQKLSAGGIPMLDPRPGTTGNGEIRVVGADGVTFVAPVLILHYVTEHHYSPPPPFIDAVLRAA
jgi:hypothetical protein